MIRTPAALLAVSLALFALAAFADEPQSHDTDLSATLAAGSVLDVEVVSGSIVATGAPGDRASIRARVSARGLDPAQVTVRAVRSGDRVLVCATLPGQRDCHDRSNGDGWGEHRSWHDDVTVDLTVSVPAGVKLVAGSVSGDVRATGLRGDVTVSAVQGDITLATSGSARATSVNGTLDVRLLAGRALADSRFNTVNGTIRLALPRGADATLQAETLSGSIRGEGGVTFTRHDGEYVGHSGTAVLGNGAVRISLHTVNGEIVAGAF
jgi:hypothetical protein